MLLLKWQLSLQNKISVNEGRRYKSRGRRLILSRSTETTLRMMKKPEKED